jgi:hypothetical protein
LPQGETLTAPAAPKRHALGWVAAFATGYLAGFAPFLIPALDDLVRLIPQGLDEILGPLTGVLTGLLALGLRYRDLIGRAALRKLFRIAAGGLPAGFALLLAFQPWFVVRHPIRISGGERAAISVIVSGRRTRECLCDPRWTDERCLEQSAHPDAVDRCWGAAAVRRNQALWSFAYLFSVAGLCSAVGALRLRSPAPVQEPEAGPSRPVAGPPQRRLFLSYSTRDRDFAERLVLDLTERGIPVWWDRKELAVGSSLPREIGDAIAASAWFGILLSPEAVASRWVGLELDTALALEVETGGTTVLPLLCRPCDDIPPALRRKSYADFTKSYDDGLAALLRALQG